MALGAGETETRRALPEDASAYGERTKLPVLGLSGFSSPSTMKADQAAELLGAFLAHFPKREMMAFSGATSGMGITAWDFAEAAQGPLNLLAYLNGGQPRTNDVAVTVRRPVPDEKATNFGFGFGFETPARPVRSTPASPAQAPAKAAGGRAAATPMQAIPFSFDVRGVGDDSGYDFGAESDFGEAFGRHAHVEFKPEPSMTSVPIPRGGIVAGLSNAVSGFFSKAPSTLASVPTPAPAPAPASASASTPARTPEPLGGHHHHHATALPHTREAMYLYSKTGAAKPAGAVRHCEGSTCRGAAVQVTARQALADRSVPCKVCCKSESGDVQVLVHNASAAHSLPYDDRDAPVMAALAPSSAAVVTVPPPAPFSASRAVPNVVSAPSAPSAPSESAPAPSALLYAVVTATKHVMAPHDYLRFVIEAGGAQLTLHAASCASARNAMSSGRCIGATREQWDAAYQHAAACSDTDVELRLKEHTQCAGRI